jgi:hypothetical protein
MFRVSVSGFEELQKAIKEFQGNAEEVINGVLHNEGAELIQESIRQFMPVSGKKWKGKKAAAKSAKSMRHTEGNLSVTVRSAKSYQYLYFPDDGTNTRRHIGDQQFFLKGAEAVTDDILERCVGKLINKFEEGA